jgi:hypothetical protein
MDLGQIHVAHVGGAVVVLDLPARPVKALHDEVITRLDRGDHRDIRVPAIMDHVVVVRRRAQVDLDDGFRHVISPSGRFVVWKANGDRNSRETDKYLGDLGLRCRHVGNSSQMMPR